MDTTEQPGMNCFEYNEPVVYVNINQNEASCYLSQKGYDALDEAQRNADTIKTLEQLFPDSAEREKFIAETGKEMNEKRKEIKREMETVKDCHKTFADELMKKCHKNLMENNIHNIQDMYNEFFNTARSNWDTNNSLKNLRKVAECYAALMKIDALKAKKDTENVDEMKGVNEGILKEMKRLNGLCIKELRTMHENHLADIKEYLKLDFDELISKKQ